MRGLAWLLLAGATFAHAGDPPWAGTRHARENVTVDFLYETCSAVGQTAHGMIPHFDCESYVYGVLDAHVAVRDRLPTAQRACFPGSLPPWKALEQALSFSDAQRTQNAASYLIEALRKAYPCK